MNDVIDARVRRAMAIAILENPFSHLALRRLAWWSLLSLRSRAQGIAARCGSGTDDAA